MQCPGIGVTMIWGSDQSQGRNKKPIHSRPIPSDGVARIQSMKRVQWSDKNLMECTELKQWQMTVASIRKCRSKVEKKWEQIDVMLLRWTMQRLAVMWRLIVIRYSARLGSKKNNERGKREMKQKCCSDQTLIWIAIVPKCPRNE